MLEEGREVWWKFNLYYFISFHIKVSPGKSFKKRQSAFPWFLSDPATSPTFITPKRLSNNKQLLFHPHLSLESRSKANANYLDNSCKSCTFFIVFSYEQINQKPDVVVVEFAIIFWGRKWSQQKNYKKKEEYEIK